MLLIINQKIDFQHPYYQNIEFYGFPSICDSSKILTKKFNPHILYYTKRTYIPISFVYAVKLLVLVIIIKDLRRRKAAYKFIKSSILHVCPWWFWSRYTHGVYRRGSTGFARWRQRRHNERGSSKSKISYLQSMLAQPGALVLIYSKLLTTRFMMV